MGRIYDRLQGTRGINERGIQRYTRIDVGTLKRMVIASVIFVVFYGMHVSNTAIGRWVDNGVYNLLTKETDLNYWLSKGAAYAESNFDWGSLRQIKATVSKPADPLLYMVRPVTGQIVTSFNPQGYSGLNDGIEFLVAGGSSVRSSAAGRVKLSTETLKYGKVVIVEHGQEIESIYSHLGEVLVKTGDPVSQGQIIARAGAGEKDGVAKIYFELREKGKAIDPVPRIKAEYPLRERK